MNQPHLEPQNLLGEGKRFTMLLVTLLIVFQFLPTFSDNPGAFALVNDLAFTGIIIAAVYSLCENRKYLIYAWLPGFPAILLHRSYWLYP